MGGFKEELKEIVESNIVGILDGWHVLKYRDGLLSFFIVFVVSLLFFFLTDFPFALEYWGYKPTHIPYHILIIAFLIAPILQILEYSAPLKNPFKNLVKYFSFLIFDIVSLGILFVFIFLMILVGVGAEVVGGTVCFIITLILFLVLLFYFEYRLFTAPAYLVLSDVGSIESLLYSWSFTKHNSYALGFFIKMTILYLIFVGLSYIIGKYLVFSSYYTAISVSITYCFFYILYTFIVSSSVTLFVEATTNIYNHTEEEEEEHQDTDMERYILERIGELHEQMLTISEIQEVLESEGIQLSKKSIQMKLDKWRNSYREE